MPAHAKTSSTFPIAGRLIALCAGVVLACLIIVGVSFALPAQGQGTPNKAAGYVYSGPKSESVEYTTSTMEDDSMLVFGSSELSTSKELIGTVPAAVFGDNDYGLQLTYVGEAYDQSLWHAIALGAYADADLPTRKVVFSVGPGWFVDGGIDNETFKLRFSYPLYRAFMANQEIDPATKDYVTTRLLEQGIDETKIEAAEKTLPQDFLNDAVFSAMDDARVRKDLQAVRLAVENASAAAATATDVQTGEPDFELLRAEALPLAEASSTSNPYGLEDGFWQRELGPVWDDAAGMRAGETFSDTPEYDDFACFLDVCRETGIEPLIVLSPVFGPYYDHIGVTAASRASCYDRIREIAAAYGVPVADFSDREYEPYFLFDIVHYGWLGWVDVDEAIYQFAKGSDS